MKKYFIYLLLIISATSCVSKKKIIYFQGSQNFNNTSNNYEPIIQNDDMLYINVSSFEPEASAPFNLETLGVDEKKDNNTTATNFLIQKQTYLVDNNGNIEFPVIGTLAVAGYSIINLKEVLKKKLAIYIKDPVINIRIVNFKVSVLGEVMKPGIISFDSQRITLVDALAKAGDLTIFGKRNNILIVRDYQGIKTYNRIDITAADFVNSPFYYLDQNDVVYVEPSNAKVGSATFGTNFASIVSLLGLGLTIVLILK